MRHRAAEAEMLLGVDVKPSSRITVWSQWPDDVRDLLLGWNRGTKERPMKLSFYRRGVFDCADCGLRCEGNTTVAILNDRWLCDDCLILVARSVLDRETPDG